MEVGRVFHWSENCGTVPSCAFLLVLVLSISKKILVYSTRLKVLGSSPSTNKNQNYRCWLVRQDQEVLSQRSLRFVYPSTLLIWHVALFTPHWILKKMLRVLG